jgi:hypothetical protein
LLQAHFAVEFAECGVRFEKRTFQYAVSKTLAICGDSARWEHLTSNAAWWLARPHLFWLKLVIRILFAYTRLHGFPTARLQKFLLGFPK